MPDFDLSITICSWNTEADLRICLASLEAIRDEASFEVLVVDNNSEDGSPDMVEREFPWVNQFRLPKNLGFTGGNNYALERMSGSHALLLNSDTIVHPGAIRELLAFLERHPKVGIIGPKLLNSDGSLQYSARTFPNPVAALFRNTPLGKLFPKNRFTRDYLMQDWDHQSEREVDWVSGAALLARDELLAKIGFLDPNYYMFLEDVDWCYRSWEAGFSVMYVPSAVITHAIGRSTDKAPNRMIFTFHKSMLRFYCKHMLPKQPVLLRPLSLLAASVAVTARASIFLAKNKFDAIGRKMRRR
jgi:GT2 family glycosyltransferase